MSKVIYSALLAACLLSVVPEALSCEGDPNEGKDPSRDPMVQARVGTWKVMEKVESILIVR
ncbi:MAG TPA: hypothetical protein VLJ37_11625 [bacterium]|nr:hypothetical protein [bacterium]